MQLPHGCTSPGILSDALPCRRGRRIAPSEPPENPGLIGPRRLHAAFDFVREVVAQNSWAFTNMNKRIFFLSFLLFFSLCARLKAPGDDTDGPNGSTLSLTEVLSRIEQSHPWLRGSGIQARIGEARLAATQARPAGEASLTVENIGTGELSGIDALETTLSYGQTIQSSERVEARSLVAHELNAIDRLQWNERRRILFAEATRRFIEVAASQADLAAAHEQVELAIALETATRERLEKAVGTPADVARAHHARVVAEIEAEHIEHTLLSARHGLSLLWNAETPDFETVSADLDNLPLAAPYETLAARLEDAPSQARFAAITRLKLAEESLARTVGGRGLPSWTAGIRRLEAVDSWGLVFGLNYAWPESELSSARAAESKAEREFSEIEGEAALIEARQMLFELTQELGHARIEHEASVNELIPAARSWLANVESGMSTARFAIREILEAQAAVVEAQRHKIGAAAEYHQTLAAIETLLGSSAAAQP